MSIFGGLSTPQWLNPQNLFTEGEEDGRANAATFMKAYQQAHQDAIQKPLMDLKMQGAALDLQSKALDIQTQSSAMEAAAQSKTGETALAGVFADAAKTGSWNNPDTISKIFGVAAKFPSVQDSPAFKNALGFIDKSTKAQQMADRYQQQADDNASKLALSQERIDLLQAKTDSPAGKVKENTAMLDQIDQVKADAEKARVAGNTTEFQRLSDRANKLTEMLPTHGQEATTIGYDDQNRPIVSITKGGSGGPGGKATVGTASAGQQKLLKYENATQLLNTLEKNLTPKDVGAAGVGGEYLLDRGMAQLDPRFANKSRIANRDALTIAKESLLREVGDDRRFTAKDREDIASALPSNGVFESYTDAMQRISTVRKIISDRARNNAEMLGEPVPMFAQTKDEIVSGFQKKKAALTRALQAGTITQADYQTQLSAENDKALSALVKFH